LLVPFDFGQIGAWRDPVHSSKKRASVHPSIKAMIEKKLPDGGDDKASACIPMKEREMARSGNQDLTVEAVGKGAAQRVCGARLAGGGDIVQLALDGEKRRFSDGRWIDASAVMAECTFA
jgi:hypothetical protein